jgi:formylglycine-generating enzyme required for sulfatase activity
VAQANAYQDAWAKHLGVPIEFTNSIGMKFRLIPPGEFLMGAADDDTAAQPSEKPQHKVTLTRPVLMGAHEVTVGQFRKFVEASGYKTNAETSGAGGEYWDFDQEKLARGSEVTWATPPFEQAADHPVCCVSWNDAQRFCEWLSRTDGRGYALPTEAQWEFACRAGTTTPTPFGSAFDPTKAEANIYRHHKGTCAVGSYPPNAFGLHDVIGNVYERCQDPRRNYRPEPATDPTGRLQDPVDSVLRGGCFSSGRLFQVRSATRAFDTTSRSYAGTGFRVAILDVAAPLAPARFESFTDTDVRRVAALPAAEQVEAVRKELMRRNPGFDGEVGHKIEGGVVTEFWFGIDWVTDISPIRVWSTLRRLRCRGTHAEYSQPDLSPLAGMNLAGLVSLELSTTQVSDAALVYFETCKDLNSLDLRATRVTDAGLAHFKGCKNLGKLDLHSAPITGAGLVHFKDCKQLIVLSLANTKTRNAGLAHIRVMPLKRLLIHNTDITDLTPLQGMPLEDIRLTPKNITQGLNLVRDIKSLKTIGIDATRFWPAAEFWERYDTGEFQ